MRQCRMKKQATVMPTAWQCPNCWCDWDLTDKRYPFVCRCGGVLRENGKFRVYNPDVRVATEFDEQGRALPMSKERRAQLIGETVANREAQGARAWARKHLYRGCERLWHVNWEKTIPATGCQCKRSYSELVKKLPPRFDSPEDYFAWGYDLHNLVNEKRGVPTITLGRARMLWRHERPDTGRTRLVITVATGYEYRALHKLTGPFMQAYADRCDADFIVLDNVTEDWWGFEKFRIRHFAEQYDETLFIDTDAIVRHDCPSLFGSSRPLVLHDDWSKMDWWHEGYSKSKAQVFNGLEYDRQDSCLNSGVVYCHRSHADVWQPGEVNLTAHCAEQMLVEQNAIKLGYDTLPDELNWQWYFKDFEAGIKDAKIIHLASCRDKIAQAKRIIELIGGG